MSVITHVSVRYNEGGAARVARSLHNAALHAGMDSEFWYGYGPSISPDEAAVDDTRAVMMGSKPRVLANFAEHSVLGTEHIAPNRTTLDAFRARLIASAVVHLHVVHSYFMPLKALARLLRSTNAQLVWTLHDFWPLTGRCAVPGACTKFATGCGSCPDRTAYPGGAIDLTRRTAIRRRRILQEFADRLTFVAPSDHVRRAALETYPEIRCPVILNSVDDIFCCSDATQGGSLEELKGLPDGPRVLFVASDLSDATKRIRPTLELLASDRRMSVVTVGENPSVSGDRVVNFGRVNDPRALRDIYRSMHATVFTSKVDTFGLVMAESLACGTPVLALDSAAAREVLGEVGGRPVESIRELQDVAASGSALQLFRADTREELAERARAKFGGARGIREYFAIYREPTRRQLA